MNTPRHHLEGLRQRPSLKLTAHSLLAAVSLLFAGLLPAPSAAQCLLTDFEGLAEGANGLYLFRRPGFSGAPAFVDPSFPDSSKVSREQSHSGSASLKVQWKFKRFVSNPYWLRLTTFQNASAT